MEKMKRTSKVFVTIRALPALATSIAATEDNGERAFLVAEFGKPFTSNGFGNGFRKRCNEAGVPGSAHGYVKPQRPDAQRMETLPLGLNPV
jgi:hypothetical protein